MLDPRRLSVTELSSQWMARALGVLYASGGSLAVLWLLLPHPPRAGDPVVLAMAGVAVTLGLALALGPTRRLPRWTLHAVIALIQVVISVGYAAEGNAESDLRLFYAWATPYAAFFFGRRSALAQSAWTGVCLAGSLAVIGAPAAASSRVWLLTMGTVAAVGVLVGTVAGRTRRIQQQLHEAIVADPLTGLANRVGFARALDAALATQRRHGGAVVVVLVDLDHFKDVNDSYGHQVGDLVLREVADRLVRVFRSEDLVARMGGDEFAVVCSDSFGDLDVQALVARLEQVWVDPVPVAGRRLRLSGSAGLVCSARPGDTATSLLHDADVALYRAKATQRGTATLYDASLLEQLDRAATIDRGLRRALENDELALDFQGIADPATGRLVAAEALLRGTCAELGPVPVAELRAVAQQRGLADDLGAWTLDAAAAQLSSWWAAGLVDEDFSLTVHVSGGQLHAGLPGLLAQVLQRHRLPAGALTLAVDQACLAEGPAPAGLEELAAAGTPIVLDGFGVGSCSPSALLALPLSGVRIDRSLTDLLSGSGPHRKLLAALLTMTEELGLTAVVDGVTDEQVAAALRSLGCRRAQGIRWSRPEPPELFARRMHRQTLRATDPSADPVPRPARPWGGPGPAAGARPGDTGR